MELFRTSRDVYGREVLEGMNQSLARIKAAAER